MEIFHLERGTQVRTDHVPELTFEGLPKLIEGSKLSGISGSDGDLLLAIAPVSVGQGELQGGGGVQVTGIVGALSAAGNLGPYASYGTVIPGMLQGDAVLHQGRQPPRR
jgi:hypothetical protein